MGLVETVQSLILVKADTSQAKAEVKSLRGAEKAAAKERLAEIEATNKGIDDQIKSWVKFAAGVGAAVGAFKLAQHAAKSYLEDVRLQAAAGSANIERLQKATRGLVEADTLLAFAGKAQAGVWKLNQTEMETVLRGADALRKKMGVELQPTVEKLTEAVAKGSTRALKEFGIEAEDKQGVLRELSKTFDDLGGNTSMAGDSFEAAGVKWKDSIDDLIGALGELVMALEPVIRMAANAASSAAQASSSSDWILQAMGRGELGRANMEKYRQLMGGGATGPGGPTYGGGPTPYGQSPTVNAMRRIYRAAMDGVDRALAETAEEIEAIKRRKPRELRYEFDRGQRLELRPDTSLRGLGGDLGGGGAIDALGMKPGGVEEGMAARARELLRMQAEAEQRKNLFESIFGTPQAIDATALAVYGAAKAFQLLEAAATAALDAFITGQMSMAQAVKAAIAQGLKAVAIDASIQALKNTAYGFAALATGPIGGVSAGGFFKAAALFGGVAVAAGAGAKAAYSAGWAGGGSAGGAPAGTSAGGYIGGGSNGHTGGTSNTVIYVTGDAYRMSQAEREHRISDAARRGQQKRSSNVVAHS